MANVFKKFLKGILLRGESSDPGDNLPGSMWHNSTSGRIKAYVQSAVRTLVSEDQSQTLTNKTIDADSNTISNIDNADIKSGAAIDRDKLASGTADRVLINNGSGVLTDSTITTTELNALSGVSGTLVSTAASQTLTNKTIDGGNNTIQNVSLSSLQESAGAGYIFVQRNPSGGIQALGSVPTGVVVGTTDSQVITNKDIDGGSASNTRRITLPKDTRTNLEALTRKQGNIFYDTTNGVVVYDNGTSLVNMDTPTSVNFRANTSTTVASTSVNFKFTNVQTDNQSIYNSGTGIVTIPFNGFYLIIGSVYTTTGFTLRLYIDGVLRTQFVTTGSAATGGGGSDLRYLNAGQTLELRPDTNATASAVNQELNFFAVTRVNL